MTLNNTNGKYYIFHKLDGWQYPKWHLDDFFLIMITKYVDCGGFVIKFEHEVNKKIILYNLRGYPSEK